jgi:hypothetical protein
LYMKGNAGYFICFEWTQAKFSNFIIIFCVIS